jgi:hypothetical protein
MSFALRPLPTPGIFLDSIKQSLLKTGYQRHTYTVAVRVNGARKRTLKVRTDWQVPSTPINQHHSLAYCWRHYQMQIISARCSECKDIPSANDSRPPLGSLVLVLCNITRVFWPALVVPPKYARLEMNNAAALFGTNSRKYKPGKSIVVRYLSSSTTPIWFKLIADWEEAVQRGMCKTWTTMPSPRNESMKMVLLSSATATAAAGGESGVEKIVALLRTLLSQHQSTRVTQLSWSDKIHQFNYRTISAALREAEHIDSDTKIKNKRAKNKDSTSFTATTTRTSKQRLHDRLCSSCPFEMVSMKTAMPRAIHYFSGAGFLLTESWLTGIWPLLAIDCDGAAMTFCWRVIKQFIPTNPPPFYLTKTTTSADLRAWCSARNADHILLLVGFLGGKGMRRRGQDNVTSSQVVCGNLNTTMLDELVKELTENNRGHPVFEFYSSCCWDLTHANATRDENLGRKGLNWCVTTGQRHCVKNNWTRGFVGENVDSAAVRAWVATAQKKYNLHAEMVNELDFPMGGAARKRMIYSSSNLALTALRHNTKMEWPSHLKMSVAKCLHLPKAQHATHYITGGSWSSSDTENASVRQRHAPCVTSQPTFLSTDRYSKGRVRNDATDRRLTEIERLMLLGWTRTTFVRKIFLHAVDEETSRSGVGKWVGNGVGFGTGVVVSNVVVQSVCEEASLIDHIFRYMVG